MLFSLWLPLTLVSACPMQWFWTLHVAETHATRRVASGGSELRFQPKAVPFRTFICFALYRERIGQWEDHCKTRNGCELLVFTARHERRAVRDRGDAPRSRSSQSGSAFRLTRNQKRPRWYLLVSFTALPSARRIVITAVRTRLYPVRRPRASK